MNIEQEMALRKLLNDPREFRRLIGKMRRVADNIFDEDERIDAMDAIDQCQALFDFASENYRP